MPQLTADDVKKIRAEYNVVMKNHRQATNVIELAKRYGTSQETIRNIANRLTYKWVS
jgi:Mor family transcriptional regulator